MLSYVGVSCWYCRQGCEIFSGPLPGKSLCGVFLFFCVMTTCYSHSKIIPPSASFFSVFLLVPWSGVPCHWIVGMERKGEFTAFISLLQWRSLQLLTSAYKPWTKLMICIRPLWFAFLLYWNGMSGFPERNAPLNNGQKNVSDAFHRFTHCVLSRLGVMVRGGGQSSVFSSIFTLTEELLQTEVNP